MKLLLIALALFSATALRINHRLNSKQDPVLATIELTASDLAKFDFSNLPKAMPTYDFSDVAPASGAAKTAFGTDLSKLGS